MSLSDGFHDIPAGKIAAVVTYLEMRARPEPRPEPTPAPWHLRRVAQPDGDWYRALYRRVGEDWLWFSRLVIPESELDAVLRDPGVAFYALEADGRDMGLLELDFRQDGECELAFFGLAGSLHGQGAGRWLMNRALELAWERPIQRLWLHTCTLDHPQAIAFYSRSGFRPYARQVEVADDPRLIGKAPRDSAPHIPII
ncbi:GNAT family N-acetyltransferase [Aquibaculum sediminis]|uniref:GNAT family N-acetyltransferase n=1 Tax=Aquibaculum sediminis TaxID=3231907 RepID=UPI003452D8F6